MTYDFVLSFNQNRLQLEIGNTKYVRKMRNKKILLNEKNTAKIEENSSMQTHFSVKNGK